MRENPQSSFCAEIIREFMEFYRLNYSLAIFGPESNLKGKTENRNSLAEKAGVVANNDKPILMQIIEALQSGNYKSKPIEKAAEPASTKLFNKEPLPNLKHQQPSSTDKHLEKASNLLEELSREEKSGLNWKNPQTKQETKPKPVVESDKASSYGGIADNYDDDFDVIESDIQEDLPADDHYEVDPVGASGQGITVSQSLGVDPSVDSLALEDYDHVEPVERLMWFIKFNLYYVLLTPTSALQSFSACLH